MSVIFALIFIAASVCAAVNGSLAQTAAAMLDSAANSVTVLLSFAGIICFWSGILAAAKAAGICAFTERLLSPIIRRLFPRADAEARQYIALNLSANLLGMGNAATPMGIAAMERLDALNPRPDTPSAPMRTLIALNCASVQLLPTTVIALRAANGSISPSSVIAPIWLSSVCGLLGGLLAAQLYCRIRGLGR